LFGGAQSGEFAALIDGHPTLAGSEVAAKEGYSEVAGVPVAYKIAPSFPVSRGSHRVRGPFRLRFTYATPVLVKKVGMEMPGQRSIDEMWRQGFLDVTTTGEAAFGSPEMVAELGR
jgi:hypothetical protein